MLKFLALFLMLNASSKSNQFTPSSEIKSSLVRQPYVEQPQLPTQLVAIIKPPYNTNKPTDVKQLSLDPNPSNLVHQRYGFQLIVPDHNQQIQEQADLKKGQYSLVAEDGSAKTIKYSADRFNSDVIYHPPPPLPPVVAVAPVKPFAPATIPQADGVRKEADKVYTIHTIGVGRGDNGDWVDRRRTKNVTTERSSYLVI